MPRARRSRGDPPCRSALRRPRPRLGDPVPAHQDRGEELAPSTLVLARTALAAVVLAPFALARREVREALPALARRWKAVAAYTGFEIVGPWLFLARAEHDLPSSTTAVVISAVPVVGVLVALASRRAEHLGAVGWTGLALGTLGVATLVGFDLQPGQFGAVAELAVVVVGYAIGPAVLARHLGDLPGTAVVLASLVLAALVYVPVVALGPGLPATVPSGQVLASVAVLALVCTAGAFLLLFALVGEIGPVRATAIVYVNPSSPWSPGRSSWGSASPPRRSPVSPSSWPVRTWPPAVPRAVPTRPPRRLPWRHDAGRGAALGPRPARPRHRDAAAAAPRRG